MKQAMRASDFLEPGQIVFRSDATRPEPSAGEVLVAVEACGICGSDLHMYRNNSLRQHLVRTTPEGYDVPGHEFAGTIATLGEGVSGWREGERVVGVTGHGGGMAEYVTVPVNPFQLVRVPSGVSYREAATTEPLADALQMLRLAELAPGNNVVVFGVGIIGLGVVQALRALYQELGQVIAIDVHRPRLDMARHLGATACVDAREGRVFEAVAAACGTSSDWHGDESANVDVVFDCAGYIKHMPGPPPLETALRLLRHGGSRVICFGAYEDRMSIDFGPMISKQPVIKGSNGYAADELLQALDLMGSGQVDRAQLISHAFPLEDVGRAFETQGGAEAIKVMLDIRPQD